LKGLTILALGVAIALGVLAYRQSATIYAQQAELAALGSQVSAGKERANSASLDLQAKCSAEARKTFAESGFKASDGAGYENHYNTKLNRCFVDVQNIKPDATVIWTYRNVFDAFEGKQYGTYAWRTEGGKKFWEVAPVICEVTSPTGERQFCHSDEEFSKLVKVYMGGD
jgi:hypothetical protein